MYGGNTWERNLFSHSHVSMCLPLFSWMQFSLCWTSFSTGTNKIIPICQHRVSTRALHWNNTGLCQLRLVSGMRLKRATRLEVRFITCGWTCLHWKLQVDASWVDANAWFGSGSFELYAHRRTISFQDLNQIYFQLQAALQTFLTAQYPIHTEMQVTLTWNFHTASSRNCAKTCHLVLWDLWYTSREPSEQP